MQCGKRSGSEIKGLAVQEKVWQCKRRSGSAREGLAVLKDRGEGWMVWQCKRRSDSSRRRREEVLKVLRCKRRSGSAEDRGEGNRDGVAV